jgi:hypothetical protein
MKAFNFRSPIQKSVIKRLQMDNGNLFDQTSLIVIFPNKAYNNFFFT